jgi:hypothetical protein
MGGLSRFQVFAKTPMKSAFWDECRSHNTPFPGDKSLFSGWHGSDKDAGSFFLFFVNGCNRKHCFPYAITSVALRSQVCQDFVEPVIIFYHAVDKILSPR